MTINTNNLNPTFFGESLIKNIKIYLQKLLFLVIFYFVYFFYLQSEDQRELEDMHAKLEVKYACTNYFESYTVVRVFIIKRID